MLPLFRLTPLTQCAPAAVDVQPGPASALSSQPEETTAEAALSALQPAAPEGCADVEQGCEASWAAGPAQSWPFASSWLPELNSADGLSTGLPLTASSASLASLLPQTGCDASLGPTSAPHPLLPHSMVHFPQLPAPTILDQLLPAIPLFTGLHNSQAGSGASAAVPATHLPIGCPVPLSKTGRSTAGQRRAPISFLWLPCCMNSFPDIVEGTPSSAFLYSCHLAPLRAVHKMVNLTAGPSASRCMYFRASRAQQQEF